MRFEIGFFFVLNVKNLFQNNTICFIKKTVNSFKKMSDSEKCYALYDFMTTLAVC